MEFINHMKNVLVTFTKKIEIFMDKPFYFGFAVLELSKFIMFETFYHKLQPYFSRKNLQLQ